MTNTVTANFVTRAEFSRQLSEDLKKKFTKRQLDQAKKRLLEKCRGKLSITPIETTNVECIIDLFLEELSK